MRCPEADASDEAIATYMRSVGTEPQPAGAVMRCERCGDDFRLGVSDVASLRAAIREFGTEAFDASASDPFVRICNDCEADFREWWASQQT